MKISLDWLRDLVTWDVDTPELVERLTLAGLNVEEVEEIAVTFPEVVVARVLAAGKHPDADRLSLCQVEDGSGEPVQVVCGAPNVREGLTVLFARVGAVLPGGLRIKKTKIRGVESRGMICSAIELGLGDDADGIIELETEATPGTPADELYGYRDTVLDVEVTPNRPDWLSHIGVAREVAAIFGTKLTPPPIWSTQSSGDTVNVKIEIEDFEDCPRYTAHIARGVKIGPAPRIVQNRLRAIGARPINNIVDITNYVLYELGQPLHAFDLGRLAGERLLIRRAGEVCEVTTLDGETRILEAEDLVIADSNGPVAIAGVMGLANSEVGAETGDILLESAFFSPSSVRRTSRRLGLVSESSYRFEREADWEMVEQGARRALHLLQEYAGAEIAAESADRGDPDRKKIEPIPLRVYQMNRVLGTDIGTEEAAVLLQSLGLKVQPMGNPDSRGSQAVNMMVEVPSFRRDLKKEVDLLEEVARIHGYDKIVGDGRFRGSAGGRRRLVDLRIAGIRRYLVAGGYAEILTSSFMAGDAVTKLELAGDDPRRYSLTISNPHHGGDILLRTTLLPSLIDVARRNLNADAPLPVRLFQLNKVYWPRGKSVTNPRHPGEERLPEEPLVLQIAVAGWNAEGLDGVPADLLELKGVVTELCALTRQRIRLVPVDAETYLAPGQQWRLEDTEGEILGSAGRLGSAVARSFGIDHSLAVAEIDLTRLQLETNPVSFARFSRFPAVKRDLSILVPESVSYGEVNVTVAERGGPHLETVELFDIYRGSELGAGRAALGIRLKFRSHKGNLKGETVDRAIAEIVAELDRKHGIRLRV